MADVKKMATRDGYGKALVELGKEHADLVVLDADLAGSTKTGMFAKARATSGKPFGIVMKTTKGKGVSFMENNAGWHGVAPNDAQYEQAMAELTQKLNELEGM